MAATEFFLPFHKTCPVCDDGYVQHPLSDDSRDKDECANCGGTGKLQVFITLDKFSELTGLLTPPARMALKQHLETL